MQIVTLYLSTALIFLAADAVALRFLIRPVFETRLGDLLHDPVRIAPAVLFYLFYVGALLWLVTAPALAGTGYARVAFSAAIFGAAAYGTYEFTNLATLRPWSWQMVALDLTWGTVLTTTAGTAGLWIARAVG